MNNVRLASALELCVLFTLNPNPNQIKKHTPRITCVLQVLKIRVKWERNLNTIEGQELIGKK